MGGMVSENLLNAIGTDDLFKSAASECTSFSIRAEGETSCSFSFSASAFDARVWSTSARTYHREHIESRMSPALPALSSANMQRDTTALPYPVNHEPDDSPRWSTSGALSIVF